eukprot:TRINITY_DN5807_c0_g1_i1.p1 TRINITY_DN5807_c0_g1~~TRINITY_DN5807_c0_g1_i1.p1  ORF type:complete len:114 (-),score=42.46 TRINITY_DN5807_c0_g1_i1:37-378(-)
MMKYDLSKVRFAYNSSSPQKKINEFKKQFSNDLNEKLKDVRFNKDLHLEIEVSKEPMNLPDDEINKLIDDFEAFEIRQFEEFDRNICNQIDQFKEILDEVYVTDSNSSVEMCK